MPDSTLSLNMTENSEQQTPDEEISDNRVHDDNHTSSVPPRSPNSISSPSASSADQRSNDQPSTPDTEPQSPRRTTFLPISDRVNGNSNSRDTVFVIREKSDDPPLKSNVPGGTSPRDFSMQRAKPVPKALKYLYSGTVKDERFYGVHTKHGVDGRKFSLPEIEQDFGLGNWEAVMPNTAYPQGYGPFERMFPPELHDPKEWYDQDLEMVRHQKTDQTIAGQLIPVELVKVIQITSKSKQLGEVKRVNFLREAYKDLPFLPVKGHQRVWRQLADSSMASLRDEGFRQAYKKNLVESVHNLKMPNVEEPNVEEPNVEEPNVEEPNVKEPNVEEPNVENPNIEDPNIEDPNVENEILGRHLIHQIFQFLRLNRFLFEKEVDWQNFEAHFHFTIPFPDLRSGLEYVQGRASALGDGTADLGKQVLGWVAKLLTSFRSCFKVVADLVAEIEPWLRRWLTYCTSGSKDYILERCNELQQTANTTTDQSWKAVKNASDDMSHWTRYYLWSLHRKVVDGIFGLGRLILWFARALYETIDGILDVIINLFAFTADQIIRFPTRVWTFVKHIFTVFTNPRNLTWLIPSFVLIAGFGAINLVDFTKLPTSLPEINIRNPLPMGFDPAWQPSQIFSDQQWRTPQLLNRPRILAERPEADWRVLAISLSSCLVFVTICEAMFGPGDFWRSLKDVGSAMLNAIHKAVVAMRNRLLKLCSDTKAWAYARWDRFKGSAGEIRAITKDGWQHFSKLARAVCDWIRALRKETMTKSSQIVWGTDIRWFAEKIATWLFIASAVAFGTWVVLCHPALCKFGRSSDMCGGIGTRCESAAAGIYLRNEQSVDSFWARLEDTVSSAWAKHEEVLALDLAKILVNMRETRTVWWRWW